MRRIVNILAKMVSAIVLALIFLPLLEIGRASCRERV